jgi:hypothetical protein
LATAEQADINAVTATNSNANTIQGIAGQIANNPFGPALQTAANTASNYIGGTLVPQAQGANTALYNAANSVMSAGNNELAMFYNPQTPLYNQTQQRTTDQSNVALAQAGLLNTPYGAQQTANNAQNFNIAWDTYLQNAGLSALTGAEQAFSSAGSDFANAATQGQNAAQGITAGPQLQYNAYNLPLQTASTAYAGANNAYTADAGLANSFITTGQAGAGTQNQGVAAIANAETSQYTAETAQQNAIWSGVGNLVGGVASLGTGTANNTVGGSVLSSLFSDGASPAADGALDAGGAEATAATGTAVAAGGSELLDDAALAALFV